MAEQKQDGRRPKKGGDKKKQDQPKPRHRSNWTIERKRANVERHLAQNTKRAGKAMKAATSRGTARLERRRLARLAVVEQAAKSCPEEAQAAPSR